MRALIRPGEVTGMRQPGLPARGSDEGRARSVLQTAINIVFGFPFLWCLVGAVRGPLWWSTHRLLGDGIGRNFSFVWAMVAALGALWLGVSLMFAPARVRRFTGVLLVLTGCALLLGFHP
jgi:uncharacterized membrane protein